MMARIIAVLFEENKADSYVALMLDGSEPEVLFMKGPAFTKQMGPFPLPYAEATFKKWQYRMVTNPPEVNPKDIQSIVAALRRIMPAGDLSARYGVESD